MDIPTPSARVVGTGSAGGCLNPEEVRATSPGPGHIASDRRRLLVIIPDGTRTMPMPMMFSAIEEEAGSRVAALDYLVALGTHQPMQDSQLSRLIGRPVAGGLVGGPGFSITVGIFQRLLSRSERLRRRTCAR